MKTTAPAQLADGVWRLGSPLVNWYLVEDGGRVTVVDAGLPRFRPQLDVAVGKLGRTVGDVEAVVLTHAHADHVGVAERVRTEAGARVYVHGADEQLAKTAKVPGKNERSILPYLRYPQLYRLLGHMAAAGGMKPQRIGEVTTYADGDVLDVPGRLRVHHTPGHTDGHCALHLESRGVLFAGDELCTWNPVTGRRGPQLMPACFSRSSATMLDSLGKIERLEASLVLVGHGEPWTEGAAAAVERARAVGPT